MAARGRFVCLGQDYFVSLVQVSFGWPKGSSLGRPKKNLRQVSLVWPKGSQDDILGDFVSLSQVSFGWPKHSQDEDFFHRPGTLVAVGNYFSSLGQPKKNLGQVSLAWPKGSQDNFEKTSIRGGWGRVKALQADASLAVFLWPEMPRNLLSGPGKATSLWLALGRLQVSFCIGAPRWNA